MHLLHIYAVSAVPSVSGAAPASVPVMATENPVLTTAMWLGRGIGLVMMLSVGNGCRHSIVLLLQELLAARDDDALVVVAYSLTCEVEEAVVSLVALDVADAVSV